MEQQKSIGIEKTNSKMAGIKLYRTEGHIMSLPTQWGKSIFTILHSPVNLGYYPNEILQKHHKPKKLWVLESFTSHVSHVLNTFP